MRRRGKNADIWSWQPATGQAKLGDPGCVEGVWMGMGWLSRSLDFSGIRPLTFFTLRAILLEQEANAEGASERRNTAQPKKTPPTTTNWALHSEQVKAAPFLFLFFLFCCPSSSRSRTLRRLPHEYRLLLLLFCFCLQKKVRMLWPNIHPFPLPSPRADGYDR